jgi:hypothetical protein
VEEGFPASLGIGYSCLEGELLSGLGNTNLDPLFVNQGTFNYNLFTVLGDLGGWGSVVVPNYMVSPGDYRLQEGSPARDAGTDEGMPPADIEGSPRPCGKAPDMGAHELCDSQRLRRGDGNADGSINITDAIFVLAHLFAGGLEPDCRDAADANDDGALNITDPINVLGYLFQGKGPLPEPFAACGLDTTLDALGCLTFPPCD